MLGIQNVSSIKLVLFYNRNYTKYSVCLKSDELDDPTFHRIVIISAWGVTLQPHEGEQWFLKASWLWYYVIIMWGLETRTNKRMYSCLFPIFLCNTLAEALHTRVRSCMPLFNIVLSPRVIYFLPSRIFSLSISNYEGVSSYDSFTFNY